MPSVANPPTVTGDTVRGSGNSHVRKRETLSQMMGNGTSRSSGTGLKVDLRGFADNHAGGLTPGQRDRMNRGNYGSTGHTVTIDLGGGDYRVNGRGQIRRAAFGLARKVIGVGKKLPKHLFKELLLTILDQILAQLEMMPDLTGVQTGLVIPAKQGIALWSYDPRWAVAWGAPSDIKNLFMSTTGLSEAPVGTVVDKAPGLGEYQVTSVSALPSVSNAALAAWQASGYQPYTTNRDEITTKMHNMRNVSPVLSRVVRNVVVGTPSGSLFNSHLVATYLSYRGYPRVDYRPAGFVAASARPSPGGFKYGGNNTPRPDPLPYKRKDVKIGANAWQRAALGIAFAGTEFADFIDSIYDALPYRRRYGRSYLDKMNRIYQYWGEIDWAKAMGNLIYNHYEDKMVGRVLGRIGKQLRQTSLNGMSYQYGVTSGGGSTPFIEINF